MLASLAVLAWIYNMKKQTDQRVDELELDLIRNYVTKPELKRVEDKLDSMSLNISNKMDAVNNNIFNILTLLSKDR